MPIQIAQRHLLRRQHLQPNSIVIPCPHQQLCLSSVAGDTACVRASSDKSTKALHLLKTVLLLVWLLTLCPTIFSQSAQPAQDELALRKGWQWPASSDGTTYISVCWENANAYVTERQWVREAIGNTWEAVANISFHGWGPCNSNSRGIRIVVEDIRSNSFVGYSMDGRPNGMSLNFTFNNFSRDFCQDNKEFCVKSIAVHEFGHALGFLHEQDRPDSICYEGRKTNNEAGTLTPYDKDSVMNYCNRKWNNDGNLSAYDIEGVRKIYGWKNTASRGHLTVTDELADDQVSEKVTMSLRGKDEERGAVQIFNLDSSNPKVTKGWNFYGTGTYYYKVETVTKLRDGRSIRGYAEGAWTLTNGESWELALYSNGWNPAGYLNLMLKGRKN